MAVENLAGYASLIPLSRWLSRAISQMVREAQPA